MKKIMVIAIAALLLASISQPAEAGRWHGGGGAFLLGLGVGLLAAPPLIHAAPPPVVYQPYYPAPPPEAYSPYHPPVERVWVPGYWTKRWNPYYRVWEKFWVPGRWSDNTLP